MTKYITFKHESASLKLHDFENGMGAITHVFAKERRKGHGSALMQKVVEYADANDLILTLEVRRYGHPIGPDNKELIKFYSKFGFIETKSIRDRTTVNERYYFMERPLEEISSRK